VKRRYVKQVKSIVAVIDFYFIIESIIECGGYSQMDSFLSAY